VIERATREVLERLPIRFRYGISYGPTFRYWLGFLRESEEWDRDRLMSYQVAQLRDLLIHAGKTVPYYRRIFGEYAFKPERVQTPDDLKSLPYLDKETVRDHVQEFLSEGMPERSLFRKTTSGSTGIPLAIYSDKEAEEKHWATVAYAWSKVGYSPKSRIVMFWNITEKMRRYGNQLLFSRFYVDDELFQNEMATQIRTFKPEFIFGIPSTLFLFSHFMKEKNLSPFSGIKACIVESEPLLPWQKRPIEEIFNARTFSTYGMVEKALYAFQCLNSSRYHLIAQYCVPETVPIGDGVEELVTTGLINYANPLIRYKLSDIGSIDAGGCACGKHYYQSLDLTVGRLGSLLVGRNGRLYSPLMVGVESNIFEHVKAFQLYQERPGEVVLRIVKKESFSPVDMDRIRKQMIKDMGLQKREDDLRIEIVMVDDIPRPPSQKLNMVQQMLDIRRFIRGSVPRNE
jgi:phenylacetate-CoA ligase